MVLFLDWSRYKFFITTNFREINFKFRVINFVNFYNVYTYDDIPEALRVQITYIWKDVLGDDLYIENYQPIIDD
jgi:hypothetical protein